MEFVVIHRPRSCQQLIVHLAANRQLIGLLIHLTTHLLVLLSQGWFCSHNRHLAMPRLSQLGKMEMLLVPGASLVAQQ